MTDLPDSITGNNETPQIVAPDSPIPDQIWSAIRAIVLTVTSFALGRHWIEGDIATMITALLGIVAPIIMAQLKTRHFAVTLGNLGRDRRVSNNIITTDAAKK